MNERDAISDDFGNLIHLYDDAEDVDEQFSLKMSPFGSPKNGNDFGNGAVDLRYNMEHKQRGKCVIINNTYFDDSETLAERTGTHVDRAQLTSCFKSLDFDVQNWDEKEAQEIRSGIDKLAEEDFTDHDCLVVCVLTHGDLNCLHAKDDKYGLEYLLDAFKSDLCRTLAGKPKIFIIQACRGMRLDKGSIINFDVEDSISSDVRILQEADYLVAYSTIPGYYSWRNTTNGSWFIQAFVTALTNHYRELDLLSIFTITNQKVAYDFESSTPNVPDFDKRKQIPMIVSMLTRKVYFNKSKPKTQPKQMHQLPEKSSPSCSVSATVASFSQLSIDDQSTSAASTPATGAGSEAAKQIRTPQVAGSVELKEDQLGETKKTDQLTSRSGFSALTGCVQM